MHDPTGIHLDQAGVRLDVGLVLDLRAERVLEDVIGRREAPGHVALGPHRDGQGVGQVGHLLRSVRRGADRLRGVQDRRLGLHGLQRVEHGRQQLVFDVDEAHGLLGDVGVLRSHYGHHLAGEAHAVARQDGHVLHRTPDQRGRRVGAGEHGVDAG